MFDCSYEIRYDIAVNFAAYHFVLQTQKLYACKNNLHIIHRFNMHVYIYNMTMYMIQYLYYFGMSVSKVLYSL